MSKNDCACIDCTPRQTAFDPLADRLVIRDRDSDDRRLCLECINLAGFGTAGTGGTKLTVLCQQASDVQITPVGVDPLSVQLVPAQVSAQTILLPYR